MRYETRLLTEDKIQEISKERAQELLENCYQKKAVRDWFKNEKVFRLQTPVREIWTKTDDGLIPMPGFYGVAD